MAQDLISRYVWIVDTIRRFGSITRKELNHRWILSRFSEGAPLPRRTFYNYRNAIEEIFDINIVYDPITYSYSIEEHDGASPELTEWILNSAAMTDMLANARDVSNLIVLENVPSARSHLSALTAALRERHPVEFDYHPYTRITPSRGVVIEPYFLKIFKQRWYLTGLNVKDNTIKTYALDRITNMVTQTRTYEIPDGFNPEAYFNDSYGIVFNKSDVKDIVLRVDPRQAKYFRALPLHHSQSETVADGYSLFHYRLKISDDFVQELLSYGPKVVVEKPAELRAIMRESLKESLKQYS